MHILVINNQKGGVGKTTIALHLAWYLAETGHRILFVDLDAQANASATLLRSPDRSNHLSVRRIGEAASLFTGLAPGRGGGDARLALLAASGRLHNIDGQSQDAILHLEAALAALAPDYDYCVIDTPPTWGLRNYGALRICDSLIAPIQLEDFALAGVNDLLKMITVAEKSRLTKIRLLGLLPSQFRANSPLQKANLARLVQEIGNSEMLFPAFLGLRQGYADAVSRGVPVWSIKDNAATAVAGREMRIVMALIAERVGG